ncbi:TWiK family of potassium channels protein 7-like isoform X2 [Cimex lectularius]|uniref:Potassium channel domain-containing protein n=1 Tax=Cimex lectularius TaxID=79782 RepID=A0A8I6SBI0_CIMLE|nr:TWiK family of potassium channels protein 7-like isoform X2 [Cimex lectularius]
MENLDHRLGKQETAVFFSHVFISKVTQKWWHQCLLIIIIFLYTLIGAIIFYIIEGLLYELPLFYKVEKRRGELYGKLQEITQVVNNVLIENQLILNKTKNLLFDYFDFVQDIMNQYDDKATFQVEEMAWNFLGSIVFSATTCLTIGYGNIRPVTSIGKMLSVVYAVIGIPLFLILMATLGKTIITQLRKLLHKIRMCSRGCFLPKGEYGGNRSKSRATLGTLFIDFSEEEHPNLPLWLVFNLEVIYILIGTVIIIIFDIPDFLTAFCFTFESLTTIGFGAFVPGSNVFMIVFILYIIGGITVTVVCIHVAEDIYRNRLNFATRKLGLTTENYIERHLK